jgi:hypothetical protein
VFPCWRLFSGGTIGNTLVTALETKGCRGRRKLRDDGCTQAEAAHSVDSAHVRGWSL